jgi:hypothetical protein
MSEPDNQDLTEYSEEQLQDRYTDLLVLQNEYVTQGEETPQWLNVAIGNVLEEIEYRGLD